MVMSRVQAVMQLISFSHPTIHSKWASSHFSVQIRFNSGTLKIFRQFCAKNRFFKTYEHSVRESMESGISGSMSCPARSKSRHSTMAKSGISLWNIIFWRKIFGFSNFMRFNRCEFPVVIFWNFNYDKCITQIEEYFIISDVNRQNGIFKGS